MRILQPITIESRRPDAGFEFANLLRHALEG
jgi:hypothetical protein